MKQQVKALKIDDTGSVLIQDNKTGLKLWMDVYKDSMGDLTCDWNQYIFMLDDTKDIQIKEFQENIENFRNFSEAAMDYYEDHYENSTTI
jgi:hypothetical protein